MEYTQRMCHLFQGGIHQAPVAVLYPAEGEWAGRYQPIEEVLREMDRNQIETTVVPIDAIVQSRMGDGWFQVNRNQYKCLVIPYMEFLPEKLAQQIYKLRQHQVPVVFAEDYPSAFLDGDSSLEQLRQQTECVVTGKLAEFCRRWKLLDASTWEYMGERFGFLSLCSAGWGAVFPF